MHHFAYRNGVLHAEAVVLDALARKVGTPFYCYSTATLTRHYQVFAGAFADVDALVCYAMKANSNQAVIATLASSAPAPTSSRAASSSARGCRRCPPTRSCSPASARPRTSWRSPSTKASSASMSNPNPNWRCCRRLPRAKDAAPLAFRCASIPTSTPRPITRSPPDEAENKFGIPLSRAREVYARAAKLARPEGGRRRHAYRQPDHRPRSVRQCLRAAGRIRAHAARRRPRD